MKQPFFIDDKQLFKLSTCEWYQQEKESIALSSLSRPKQENTLDYSFRQTHFPDLINNFQEEV